MHETRRVGGFTEGMEGEAAGHDLLQTTVQVSIASTNGSVHQPTLSPQSRKQYSWQSKAS